jgi:hypothetical protein
MVSAMFNIDGSIAEVLIPNDARASLHVVARQFSMKWKPGYPADRRQSSRLARRR